MNEFEQEPQFSDEENKIEPETPEEQPKNPEQEEYYIDVLPEMLGFVETEQMKQVGQDLIEAYKLKNAEESKALTNQYNELAQEVINAVADPRERALTGMGFDLRLMLIRDDGEAGDLMYDSYEIFEMHAKQEYRDDIIEIVQKLLS